MVVGAAGVRTLDATLDGPVSVSSAGLAARTAVRDSVVLRPVLVLARAGWEGKFVVAALEEAGWRVEARFGVAPDVVVRQGAGPIDTSRYAAVVALDESARASAAAVTRYARDGGGVILTGAAAPVLSAIAPAQPSRRLDARLGGLLTAVPRVGLEATALGSVSREGVVVERRGQAPVIVAAREALGRVVVQGYAETWRWRMMGGEDAVAAHRQWWSGLVASVAYAPRLQLSSDAAHTVDAAPLASLVASLGPPAPAGRALAAATDGWWTPALFGLFLLALLAEWTSRRTRGVR